MTSRTTEDWTAALVAETIAGRYPENITDIVPREELEEVKARARSDLGVLGRLASLVEAGSMSIYDVDVLIRPLVEQYRTTLRVRQGLRANDRKRRY